MAAAPVDPTGTSIEALFRPSSHYRDSQVNRLPESLTKVELLPGHTIENILATGITWEDFLRFLRNKIVWMTAGTSVCTDSFNYSRDLPVLALGSDSDDLYNRRFVRVVQGTADPVATTTCDLLLRLLGTSEQHGVYIQGRSIARSLYLSFSKRAEAVFEKLPCMA
jgi:hypothetical protein